MADDERPRTPWFPCLALGIVALLALRFTLHAVSQVVDFVSTAVVLGVVVGLVGWRVAVGSRRRRGR